MAFIQLINKPKLAPTQTQDTCKHLRARIDELTVNERLQENRLVYVKSNHPTAFTWTSLTEGQLRRLLNYLNKHGKDD